MVLNIAECNIVYLGKKKFAVPKSTNMECQYESKEAW